MSRDSGSRGEKRGSKKGGTEVHVKEETRIHVERGRGRERETRERTHKER